MYKKVDVKKTIADVLSADPELKRMWIESRAEYRVLGELARIRKASGFSQAELAEKSGNSQQVISRIENRDSSPTLKTLCNILSALDYDIQFVPRERSDSSAR